MKTLTIVSTLLCLTSCTNAEVNQWMYWALVPNGIETSCSSSQGLFGAQLNCATTSQDFDPIQTQINEN